jgi:hypothetical protein
VQVAQFCRTIPKFGTEAPRKRKASLSGVGVVSSLLASPLLNSKRRRTGGRDGENDEESEDEHVDSGVSALLETARATLHGMARSAAAAAAFNSTGSSSSSSSARVSGPGPIGIRPVLQSGKCQHNVAASSNSVSRPTGVSSSGASLVSTSASSSGATAALSAAEPRPTLKVNVVPLPTHAAIPSATTPIAAAVSKGPTAIVSGRDATIAPGIIAGRISNSQASNSGAPSLAAPSTPQQLSSGSYMSSSNYSKPDLQSHRNMLMGSAHKSLEIVDHCKRQITPADRLEIVKDLHASILVSSPHCSVGCRLSRRLTRARCMFV